MVLHSQTIALRAVLLMLAGSSFGGSDRTPSSGSVDLDLKPWLLDFNSLELQKQIGEGSFGRASAVQELVQHARDSARM